MFGYLSLLQPYSVEAMRESLLDEFVIQFIGARLYRKDERERIPCSGFCYGYLG